MLFAEDQDAVWEFAAKSADDAFSDGVHPRRLRHRRDGPQPFSVEDLPERGGERESRSWIKPAARRISHTMDLAIAYPGGRARLGILRCPRSGSPAPSGRSASSATHRQRIVLAGAGRCRPIRGRAGDGASAGAIGKIFGHPSAVHQPRQRRGLCAYGTGTRPAPGALRHAGSGDRPSGRRYRRPPRPPHHALGPSGCSSRRSAPTASS